LRIYGTELWVLNLLTLWNGFEMPTEQQQDMVRSFFEGSTMRFLAEDRS